MKIPDFLRSLKIDTCFERKRRKGQGDWESAQCVLEADAVPAPNSVFLLIMNL